MSKDKDPPKPAAANGAAQDAQARKEAKLAQALRANLRRRKAEPRRPPAGGAPESNGGDSG